MSEKTLGIHKRIELLEQLEGSITDLASQLKKQYVVDLRAPGLPDEKVKLRVDGVTPNGEKVSHTYPLTVKIPETPINWKLILTWVGIGLGGVFVLWFFIWSIRKIINRPKKEKVEEEEEEEEDDPNQPHRGLLLVRSGPLAGKKFRLKEEITTIGSLEGNQVVIQDESVSKRHAGIKIEEMRYELADFNSTNGTWVNGRKINRQFLKSGDEIRIGNSEMSFTLK